MSATAERQVGMPAHRRRTTLKTPMHERILPQIRRDIIQNRWAPGERLPEPDLCSEYGVSRTPMRDVFKILEADGLIELLPHVGAVVTRLDPPDLADRLEVLVGLEQTAAMKVARTRPPETIREVQRLHRAMTQAAKDQQAARYYMLNDEFHRAIVLGAGNDTLSRTHEIMMWHVYRARHRANEHEPLMPAAAEHHSRIVSALVEGLVEEAGREMRLHLEEVAVVVMSNAALNPSPQLPQRSAGRRAIAR
jgi:DNA-binding GntR family transcriptional regulator